MIVDFAHKLLEEEIINEIQGINNNNKLNNAYEKQV